MLADFTGLVEMVRKTVIETVDRSKPSGVYFGKVISVKPIQISVDQKLILTEEFIVLGRYITEFSVDCTIDGETWRGLRKGDKLLLFREQGGQRYCVVDWVERVDEDTRPAWVMTGEVISTAPEIKVNDYLTLTPDQLILCRNITEYQVDMSVDHNTELETAHTHTVNDTYTGGGSSQPTQHLHAYTGRKEFAVHNGLAVGNKVLLVCELLNQKWYVVEYVHR